MAPQSPHVVWGFIYFFKDSVIQSIRILMTSSYIQKVQKKTYGQIVIMHLGANAKTQLLLDMGQALALSYCVSFN